MIDASKVPPEAVMELVQRLRQNDLLHQLSGPANNQRRQAIIAECATEVGNLYGVDMKELAWRTAEMTQQALGTEVGPEHAVRPTR